MRNQLAGSSVIFLALLEGFSNISQISLHGWSTYHSISNSVSYFVYQCKYDNKVYQQAPTRFYFVSKMKQTLNASVLHKIHCSFACIKSCSVKLSNFLWKDRCVPVIILFESKKSACLLIAK